MQDINTVSIFNDVIGPIMAGPSSSHTAGPARIGKIIYNLFNEEISHIDICFDINGSYPATYRGQGSDKGFIAGLMGWDAEDERLPYALEAAGENNISYHFHSADLGAAHPNASKIIVTSKNGRTMEVDSHSTGGGAFEIVGIDGFLVQMCGDFYECICICQNNDQHVLEIMHPYVENKKNSHMVVRQQGNKKMIQLSSSSPFDEDFIEKVKAFEDTKVLTTDLIMPIASFKKVEIPFRTAQEALNYSCHNHIHSLAELAYIYECTRSGLEKSVIKEKARTIYQAMKQSINNGIKSDFKMRGFLEPKASKMRQNLLERKTTDIGVLNSVMIYATAVMEYNSSMGTVVAAPTAGSCGVLPAVLCTMEENNYPLEKVIDGLMVAGLIGVFISHQATFAAEVCACQAENGSASSMAAAAMVYLCDGTIEEGFSAAGLALQNMLGLICDPIGGLVDIPCVNRNAAAASNALTSANMTLTGFDAVIPLDEVIIAMRETGKLLPSELKCTGKGGLCITPTAMRIAEGIT
ncbi:MAG: L-serine ammonia-lyase, iron-sulfur-dependent, subunit alpha [Clostridia bacterium]|nr:L-serine ammonia-lyase, iron-sulfur-dependent, subunit alpha [Clostridia bacterium]